MKRDTKQTHHQHRRASTRGKWRSLVLAAVMVVTAVSLQTFSRHRAEASTGMIRDLAGFKANALPANDDDSTGRVDIGFPINFFGINQTYLYVNNNGNVTFDPAHDPLDTELNSSLSEFTPFDLTHTGKIIIAPFFADVDTEGAASSEVTYGTDMVDGHKAFGVNWVNVGYYSSHDDKLNSFQLVLIDRSDLGPGYFDIEFNYDRIQWETGDASDGTGGLG